MLMKTFRIFSLLIIGLLWSCSDDDTVTPELNQPTFNIIAPTDDSGLFRFENTTPDKDYFYSYWEFTVGGQKFADTGDIVEHQYDYGDEGIQIVTLTMMGLDNALQASQSLTVTLPPPPDVSFVINPENLLTNGYLTEGEGSFFTGWTANNGEDRISAQSSEVLVGNRALAVSNPEDGDPWLTQFVSDAFPTVNGENYTASMWVKGGAAEIRYSTNPGVGGDQYAGNYTVTSDWTQYSWTFTANSATTLLALDMGTTGTSFFVDAIEVVPGDSALPLPSNDSALLNGDLENTEGGSFLNWSAFNGEASLSVETSDVLSGGSALRVNNAEDGDPWLVQFVSDEFATTDGQDYTASLWIKGEGSTMRFSTNPGVGGDQYGPDYTATSEWTKYSWTFTANSATTLLALDMGATQGSFVVDAIKVVSAN